MEAQSKHCHLELLLRLGCKNITAVSDNINTSVSWNTPR